MAKAEEVSNTRSNLAKIRKHFKETGGNDSGINWFNVKAPSRGDETKVTIRVLPPWSKRAEGFFYYTCGQHFGFSIGGRNRALDCPESVEGKGKCPICMFISRLKNTGEAAHDKLAARMRPNRRYFVNVIDREEPDKIKLFGTNKKFVEAVLDASDDPDMGDITDIKTGHDITIVRRGAGLNTRYSYRVRVKTSTVDFERKDLYQLDKVVSTWMSYEDMAKIITDNYTEELKEVGLKFKASSKKKVKPVEDEDNEEDDSEEEDMEEENEEEDSEEEENEEESDDENEEDSDDEEEDEE